MLRAACIRGVALSSPFRAFGCRSRNRGYGYIRHSGRAARTFLQRPSHQRTVVRRRRLGRLLDSFAGCGACACSICSVLLSLRKLLGSQRLAIHLRQDEIGTPEIAIFVNVIDQARDDRFLRRARMTVLIEAAKTQLTVTPIAYDIIEALQHFAVPFAENFRIPSALVLVKQRVSVAASHEDHVRLSSRTPVVLACADLTCSCA